MTKSAGYEVAALGEQEAKASLASCVQSNLHLLQSIFSIHRELTYSFPCYYVQPQQTTISHSRWYAELWLKNE